MKENQLIKYCNLIVMGIGVYGIAVFYGLFSVGYNIGKQMGISDKTGIPVPDELLWEMFSKAIVAFGVFAVCMLFLFFVTNVRKGLVFVSENARLLMTYGTVITVLGILSFTASELSTLSNSIFSSGLLVLVGVCFIFISIVFKIGIKMKEEQELTI